jgi:hypothetical protein
MAPRRIGASQLRSQLRQAQQKHRQEVNRYNAAVRKYNSELKRTANQYNQEVRAHNARVRSNQRRLKNELAKLEQMSRASRTTRHVVYRRSVTNLRESYGRIENSVAAGTWNSGPELLDLAEGEAANSVEVLNALLEDTDAELDGATLASLQTTVVTEDLNVISGDLYARWKGALFSLNPRNPDAARHFCTSAREILTSILESSAPDGEVLAANPNADRTHDNRVTRRARIRHCLQRNGHYSTELAAFVDDDIDNVIDLFGEFNTGTHGEAGKFSLGQLAALKRRVEDAIVFLHRIVAQ